MTVDPEVKIVDGRRLRAVTLGELGYYYWMADRVAVTDRGRPLLEYEGRYWVDEGPYLTLGKIGGRILP